MDKRKRTKGQRSTKYTHKTKDRVTRTLLKQNRFAYKESRPACVDRGPRKNWGKTNILSIQQ
jgi:hypothetical protein